MFIKHTHFSIFIFKFLIRVIKTTIERETEFRNNYEMLMRQEVKYYMSFVN